MLTQRVDNNEILRITKKFPSLAKNLTKFAKMLRGMLKYLIGEVITII